MPLLLTPANPLKTTALLEISSVYVIIDSLAFNRKLRQASFVLGYYATEAASLPGAGAVVVLEAYASHELLVLLPDCVLSEVA